MAAGDWLLGCIPLQATDTGMFDRAYYLSGAYGLWRPVLIVGLGAVGCFLYFFLVKALNADIDAKYRKAKLLQYLCGIFTVAVALAIHLWSATLAWFTTYLGPRIGAEAAIAAVTAYQDDMLIAILPMYLPMVSFIGIHFGMLLAGKTRCPRWMLVFHPVTWNILLAGIPDIAQAMGVPAATWMSVMSQSSTNSARKRLHTFCTLFARLAFCRARKPTWQNQQKAKRNIVTLYKTQNCLTKKLLHFSD